VHCTIDSRSASSERNLQKETENAVEKATLKRMSSLGVGNGLGGSGL